MTITPSFQVWLARLSHAPQLPPRLMISFACPQGVDLSAPCDGFAARLELMDAGLCLHAAPQVDILFRLASAPIAAAEGQAGGVDGDEVVDRALFLRGLAHHRSLTVCAFDALDQAVMALEFNFWDQVED